MLRRFKLDARKVVSNTKKAVLLGDFLDDDEKKKEEEAIQEEPQFSEEDKLTPTKPLPGAPKGMKGEVEEDYTPMSAAEIAEKRKEHEEASEKAAPPPTTEEDTPTTPATFRDVMKNLLKGETPEGKKEQAQQAKYGPPEVIKNVVDTLTPFQNQLAEADVATAMATVERSALPDILKDRAKTLFNSKSSGDAIRTEQLALNLLGANTRKKAQEAEEWLRDTDEGQAYMHKAFDMYRTRRVMNMLSNTILAMEGQAVIDQPKGQGRSTLEQRTEKKRIQGLTELLNTKRITDGEFEEAKRKGMTADEVIATWATPPKETLQQKVEREYREEERRKREGNKKGKVFRLNMRKESSHPEGSPLGIVNASKLNMRKKAQEEEEEYIEPEEVDDATSDVYYPGNNPAYMEEVGFPENFKITDGYDFGGTEQAFAPGLINVDIEDPDDSGDRSDTIITDLDKPIQLPPKPFIALSNVTNELAHHDIVADNIDRALLPGGTVFISTCRAAVDPYVDLLTAKGYQLVSDVMGEFFGDEEIEQDRHVIFTKPGSLSEGIAAKLNMRKKAEGDTTGPGGDAWEYEWTSGPTPTKDEPQKRKHRFPFHNKPSGYTPGEGDQGNLHDVGPLGGQSDMNYLANVIKSMNKTADNDLFSTYSFDNDKKWLTYTLFKKAYSKFRSGDIVVQYGKTAADCSTYRRRFGSVKRAKKFLVSALSPGLATTVSGPTPDDSLYRSRQNA